MSSAAEMMFDVGALTTMTPAAVAALMSTLSRPTPARATTLRRVAAALATAEEQAGLSAVVGPGLRVTLTDAPAEVKPAGVSDDALVVHQQDIQAVVNALWTGGAEAMTIQGQRVIATTGIKCVGNTVVLHGVPYAPPYVIETIGDVDDLRAGLDASEAVRIYRQYVDAYGLGYDVSSRDQIDMPAFQGSVSLPYSSER